MSFIQIGEEFYNELSIGKVYTKTVIDEETQAETVKYFMEYLGGQEVELTYEEYNSLVGEE